MGKYASAPMERRQTYHTSGKLTSQILYLLCSALGDVYYAMIGVGTREELQAPGYTDYGPRHVLSRGGKLLKDRRL